MLVTQSAHSTRRFLRTTADPADAHSLAASRASRIRGISAVDGASAGRAWIAIEGKAAVATDNPPAVAGVGINVNGATDEAYRGHFRLLVDTCTVATMHAKQVLRDRTVDDSHTDLLPWSKQGQMETSLRSHSWHAVFRCSGRQSAQNVLIGHGHTL